MRLSVAPPVQRVLRGVQIAAALVLLGLIALLLAGTVPSVFGYESFVVLSGSMEPTISTGDVAVVAPARTDELTVGDIITYRTPQQPDVIVTHRLLAVERDAEGRLTFTTKGDANNIADQVVVEQGAVLGRVGFHLPKVGYLVNFARQTEGRILLIVIPGVLLAADYLRDRLSGRSRRQAPAAAPSPDAARLQQLLDRGRQALAAGHLELAQQAADGVLEVDARNEEAWLLKAQATADPTQRAALLRAALAVNPGAKEIAAALQALQSPQGHAVAG